MATPLADNDIQRALRDLPGWSFADDKLTKTFKFAGFKEALSFIVRVGLHAEEQGHHPELFNVYSTVRLSLNTHDAGGKVTEKDVKLARTIEEFNWLPRRG